MLSEPTTLSSVARVVADTLREGYGIDPGPLFAAAGLDPGGLYIPRGRYSFPRMQRLWQAARATTGDPCLGLRVGQRVRPTTFGVLGVSWLASGTLGEALQRLCRYSHVITTAAHRLELEVNGEVAWLRFERPAGGSLETDVAVDALFAAVVSLARMVARPTLNPAEVRLRRGGDGHAADYQRFYGCPVRFEDAVDALGFAAADLDAPLVGQDEEIALEHERAAVSYLQQLESRPVAAEVQGLLVRLLPAGSEALEEVARRLNRGLSTLQRQLQQEGVSYRQLLEHTRRALAEGYMADRRLSLGEIAYLLGFADQSAFSRAFRRWHGQSPRRYRDRLTAG